MAMAIPVATALQEPLYIQVASPTFWTMLFSIKKETTFQLSRGNWYVLLRNGLPPEAVFDFSA